MSHLSPEVSIYLTVAAVLGLIALWQIWKGFPRRVEDVPRCSACGYMMTGRDGDTCPECGRSSAVFPLARSRFAIGRQRLVVGAGLLLVAIAGPVLLQRFPVNWLQFEPTALLLGEANSSSQLTRLDAKAELWRRDVGRRLTNQQKDAFYATLPQMLASVRPLVTQGDKVPIAMALKTELPQAPDLHVDYSIALITLDGKPIASPLTGKFMSDHSSAAEPSVGGSMTCYLSIDCNTLGAHTLTIDTEQVLSHRISNTPTTAPAIGTHIHQQTLCFEVVPPGKADVVLIHRPDLAGVWANCVAAALSPGFHAMPQRPGKIVTLGMDVSGKGQMTVAIQSPPTDFAFDVYVIFQGTKTNVGTISGHQDANMTYQDSFPMPVPQGLGYHADVILEPSALVARGTTDLTSIWGDAITLKDLPVD